ncbi:MAG TPA: hypothetical protein VHC19_08515 [Pirellulales bacterium]|nr:hypothetical protein [Pirellulales bacterium]
MTELRLIVGEAAANEKSKEINDTHPYTVGDATRQSAELQSTFFRCLLRVRSELSARRRTGRRVALNCGRLF